MELFKLLFMFIYFLGRKLCKFSAFLADALNHAPRRHPDHLCTSAGIKPYTGRGIWTLTPHDPACTA